MRKLTLLLVLLCIPRLSFACSCIATTPDQKLKDADAVFIGRVIEILDFTTKLHGRIRSTGDPVFMVIEVKDVWKVY